MKSTRQGLAALALAAAAAGGWAMLEAPAFAASGRMLVPADGAYLKECGTCHSAFSPELLPAASWRGVMQRLEDHFGEPAKLDAATHQRITDYLVAHAADRATNEHSRAIMGSLHASNAPLRITQVPYIAGLHVAVLDPLWNGTPRPKTLTECGVCHNEVKSGNFRSRIFHVNDALFRGK
jgi:cytochrome c553